jgi:glucosamine 6-phosphate synthetase-like amidotransferase/phosphosugar isomerase protein
VGVANSPSSFVAKNSDLTLLTYCGEEKSTSSKTYVVTLEVLFLLACALTGNLGEKKYKQLYHVINLHQELLERSNKMRNLAKFLATFLCFSLLDTNLSENFLF